MQRQRRGRAPGRRAALLDVVGLPAGITYRASRNFTADPSNGARDRVVVEGAFGQGEAGGGAG